MTVVIDLCAWTFVDSTGIGLMVRFENLKRRDINVKFVNAIASVKNVVRQTQLEELLLRLNMRGSFPTRNDLERVAGRGATP